MCYIHSFFLLRFRYVTNFFVLSFPFGTTDLFSFIPKIIIIFLKIGCSQQNEMLNLDLKNIILVCRRIIGCCYYSTDGIYHSFSSSLLYQQEYHLICYPELGRYWYFSKLFQSNLAIIYTIEICTMLLYQLVLTPSPGILLHNEFISYA